MKYIVIDEKNVVMEIIPEFIPALPNVPINERYEADFLEKCIVISDDIACEKGYIYDENSHKFYEPTAPSPSFSLEEAIAYKCDEINNDCEKAIILGFDFDENHYSLTLNDQSNIISLTSLAMLGQNVPYHADNEECRLYSAEEFLNIVNTATYHKTHNTTYCNLLKLMVSGMHSLEDVYAVTYGVTELSAEFKERYDEIMASISA